MSHMFDQETTFEFIARRKKEIHAQEWEKTLTPEKEPEVKKEPEVNPEPKPASEPYPDYTYCDG